MTEIRYYKSKDDIQLNISGHSNYRSDITGTNDVCVAVSTLIIELALAMELEGLKPQVLEDGEFEARIDNPSDNINSVVGAMISTFGWLKDNHPDCIEMRKYYTK